MTRSTVLLLASALTLSSPALAQDLYWGAGLAYTSGTSDGVTGGSGSSDLSTGMVSFLLGQRFDRGSVFFGWEANADLSFGAETEGNGSGESCAVDGASGSYLCSHDATVRIVGQFGTTLGQGTDVFGSLGIGMLSGDFADSTSTVESASVKGMTAGIGVNHTFASGLVGRGEVIYDKFDNSTQAEFDSEYSGTTVRFAIVSRF